MSVRNRKTYSHRVELGQTARQLARLQIGRGRGEAVRVSERVKAIIQHERGVILPRRALAGSSLLHFPEPDLALDRPRQQEDGGDQPDRGRIDDARRAVPLGSERG